MQTRVYVKVAVIVVFYSAVGGFVAVASSGWKATLDSVIKVD